MKTKTIFKTLALATMMPAMLLTTACSSDDDAIINNNETPAKKGYTLPVTINVTRQSEAATRATYTDNGNKTGSLSFNTGDKLFVTGAWEDEDENYYCYAGMLNYVSDGTFSGTIITQTEWTGTIEGLLGGASANLLPAGYEEYGYLSIADEGTYGAYLSENSNKAFATSKATAVEQFSYEYDNKYSSGFELKPTNAILNFTINGLDASTEVDVVFSRSSYPENIVVSGKVPTDGDGTATFAIGIKYGNNLKDCTLTVDGNAIALPDKTVAKGKIYNISRSVAPATPALSLTSPAVGQVIGSDGKNYAAASVPAGVTKVAMIAYVSGSSGLAIALSDESTTMNWSTATTTAAAHTPVFTNGTWKLPSQDEWKNMFKAFGGNESSYSGLQTAITNAGGTALQHDKYYWSSTENANYTEQVLCMFIDMEEDYAVYYNSYRMKSATNVLVRPVLAF